MTEYLYFVKWLDDDKLSEEIFNFFEDAKSFAMSILSQQPEIHQTEVIRNDFGECIDSNEIGKVWSWEEMMSDISEDREADVHNVFTKGDFAKYADYDPANDPEFDDRDITFETDCVDPRLNDVPDNFRKPIPEGMTIEALVEEMEENEDIVECKWCDELYDKSDCRYEVNMGWLCPYCIEAIKSRGEELTFREGSLEEDVRYERDDTVELDYDKLTVHLADISWPNGYYTNDPRQIDPPEPNIKEFDYSDYFIYEAKLDDILLFLAESCITEEDTKALGSSFEKLDATDEGYAYQDFIEANFDYFFKKYEKNILEYFRDDAIEAFGKKCEDDGIGQLYESTKPCDNSLLEKLEDYETYNKRLTMCPECGADSFDIETGFCIECGFNTLHEELDSADIAEIQKIVNMEADSLLKSVQSEVDYLEKILKMTDEQNFKRTENIIKSVERETDSVLDASDILNKNIHVIHDKITK